MRRIHRMAIRGRVALIFTATALVGSILAPGANATVTPVSVFFSAAEGTPSQPIFAGGGVKINASCEEGLDLEVDVLAQVENTTVHTNAQFRQFNGNTFDDLAQAVANNDLDPGEALDLLGSLGKDSGVTGQLVAARRGGRLVTLDWQAHESPSNEPGRCVFYGIAQVADTTADAGARRRAFYVARGGDAPRTFFDDGTLALAGSCTGGEGGMTVKARISRGIATVYANSQTAGATDLFAATVDRALLPGETLPLTQQLDAADRSSGQMIVALASGVTIIVDWMAETDDGLGGTEDCVFAGTARRVAAASPSLIRSESDFGSPVTPLLNQAQMEISGGCPDDVPRAKFDLSGPHSHGSALQGTSVPQNATSGSGTAGAGFEQNVIGGKRGGVVGQRAADQIIFADFFIDRDAFDGATNCLVAGAVDRLGID